MHHQIPTSSRDGATKPQLKMFCDVKHRYKPEACGLCEVGGGAYLLPNTSLFTPRRQLWHPPALPETFPMLLVSYFLTTTHRPAAQAHGWVRAPHVPLLPSAPRSAPWRVQDEQEAVIMWSLRFMQHQKNNNKKNNKKRTQCMNEEIWILFSNWNSSEICANPFFRKLSTSYFDDFFLLSSAFVRPAGPLAPENRHICKEQLMDSERKKNSTTRPTKATESVNRRSRAQKWNLVTENWKHHRRSGQTLGLFFPNWFLWMA